MNPTGVHTADRHDHEDPLAAMRGEFLFPPGPHGGPARYFVGNSLGLQPRRARALIEYEMDMWAEHGVEGHHKTARPWTSYHEWFREPLGRLVGAHPDEVVLMNSLTVNLHLLMVSFFRPTRERFRILIEDPAFPSDLYAVQTHLRHRGLDPEEALLRVAPRPGEDLFRAEDFEAVLQREGSSIALVLLGGVNFLTGQVLEMERLVAAARDAGAMVGLDLAHGVGNIPLALHDWDVDFAAWCSYKYLNGGPGAPGGCFVHSRHAGDLSRPRFGGWWGNDPRTRFRMQLEDAFIPVASADGWQISNPPILAMAPLRAALDLFDEAGMDALRAKSKKLTGYLHTLLRSGATDHVEVVTPADSEARGCQLSLRFREGAREYQELLAARGFLTDFRAPDVIRVAPTPLYNSFREVWEFVEVLGRDLS